MPSGPPSRARRGSKRATSTGRVGMTPLGQYGGLATTMSSPPAERGQRAEEIAGQHSHPRRQPERAHVVGGHGQRSQRLVHRQHLEVGTHRSQGACDGAAARSDIGHERPRAIGDELQGALDEALGFRARDENVGRHCDPEPPELLEAQDVLDRLVGGAPLHEGTEARGGAGVHGPARLDIEGQPVAPEHGREQAEGILPGAVETGPGEAIRAFGKERSDGSRHRASPSFRRCSSLLRASTSSSRSPSRMAGSRWSVRLIRWSETRPWGKL